MPPALANNSPRTACLGERRYRVRRDFLETPAGRQAGFVSQLALDSRGRLFLVNRGDPLVQVYSPAGTLIAEWRNKECSHGHGIYISADDRVFIVDSDSHCVRIYDIDGHPLLVIGTPGTPSSGRPFNFPTDVAVSACGDIYVSDGYGNSKVHRFSSDGELIESWGEPGNDTGQFSNPHAIWIDAQSRVLVADKENHRVQVFDLHGVYLNSIDGLYLATDICEGADGTIYVSDQTPRISAFSPTNELLGRSRTFSGIGHGIAVARNGAIFVADMMPSNVTCFDPF
jgi:outer membrane protein assembly factor BamB